MGRVAGLAWLSGDRGREYVAYIGVGESTGDGFRTGAFGDAERDELDGFGGRGGGTLLGVPSEEMFTGAPDVTTVVSLTDEGFDGGLGGGLGLDFADGDCGCDCD